MVTCSATNNVGLSDSVSVTIKIDKTAPVLSLSDMTAVATGPSGAVVHYSASATDNIDPSVPAICSPASGSTFALGTTTVNCSATDEASNTSSGSFLVTVTAATATSTSTPVTPIPPTNTPGSSTSGSNSSTSIVPVTGGVIDLDCDSVFSAFGIKLSFINLCDQQTKLKGVDASGLPGRLPSGFTFVTGLDVKILNDGEVLQALPYGTGIQLDFSISAGGDAQFAVLYWNGSVWIEITQKASEENVSELVDAYTANELYQIDSADGDVYKVLTTEKTGTFVLVKK